MILLVVWFANGDGSALTTSKASSNLLNDRCVCMGKLCRLSGRIEQGAHDIRKCLIYSMKKAFQEKSVVELVV